MIGRGELAAAKILARLYPAQPVSTQVPLPDLLADSWRQDLALYHQRSSLDVVVWEPKIAVYVNDDRSHQGDFKSRRDAKRYKMLRDSGWQVLILPQSECPHLWRDLDTPEAEAEVKKCINVNSGDPDLP